MLRTTAILAAAIATFGIAFAPTATADPRTKGTGTESSQSSESSPKNKVAGKQSGRITKHTGTRSSHPDPKPPKDWRVARERTMDRYFDNIREKREKKIRDWFDSLHR